MTLFIKINLKSLIKIKKYLLSFTIIFVSSVLALREWDEERLFVFSTLTVFGAILGAIFHFKWTLNVCSLG